MEKKILYFRPREESDVTTRIRTRRSKPTALELISQNARARYHAHVDTILERSLGSFTNVPFNAWGVEPQK